MLLGNDVYGLKLRPAQTGQNESGQCSKPGGFACLLLFTEINVHRFWGPVKIL